MPRQQSEISATEYKAFKNEVLNSKLFKAPVSLSEIRIVSQDRLEIGGKPVSMSSRAFEKLCSALGLSQKIQNSLNSSIGLKQAVKLASMVLTVQSKTRQAPIGMTVDKSKGMITGFSTVPKNILPNSMFIETLETLLSNNKNLKIIQAGVNEDGINVLTRNQDWEFRIGDHKDEVFWAGFNLISDDDGVALDQYLERLVCLNGMTHRSPLESFSVNKEELVGPFLRALQGVKGIATNAFQSRVSSFMNTAASVSEVEDAVKELKKSVKGDEGKKLLTDTIPYKEMKTEFFKKTGIKNLFNMPDNIKDKTMSNMKYWDLVNGVTYIASHHKEQTGITMPQQDRFGLMKYAGNMITSNPDFYMPVKQVFNPCNDRQIVLN